MKAFPTCNWTQRTPLSTGYDEGMDLRDYFAAKAMQVYLTASMGQTVYMNNIAENAYNMADAMLAARTPPQPKTTPTVEEAFGL